MQSVPPSILPTAVQNLRRLFLHHGVLGYSIANNAAPTFSESDRMEIVQVVYLLVPQLAIARDDCTQYLKPLIREHLHDLGIEADDQLVEILKRVCDQLYDTGPTAPSRIEKMTIAKLRARNNTKYQRIREGQNHRCKFCGVCLDSVRQELDHIIPWRLIGDSPDGANWQILCPECNGSKHAYLTIHQIPETWNWVYSSVENSALQPSLATRFSALVTHPFCIQCRKTPHESHLLVFKTSKLGLHVKDHLNVFCVKCLPPRK